MELLADIKICTKKLATIKDNNFFLTEYGLLSNNKVLQYYKYIITSITIDKTNPNNSYIMWLADKVDTIDLTQSAKIIPGKISLPDIDVDVPVDIRELVIKYIEEKYGKNNVAHLLSLQTMKGRGALKDVLRAYGNISFDEMNKITECITDESKISGELEEMREETGDSSIIKWSLINNKEKLKQWCYIDDDGVLQGPLAKRFEQAIRLEGTKTSQSKHAAGIIISSDTLSDVCPMIYDGKTENQIVGLEMGDAEEVGLPKIDILGIAMLDKVMKIRTILKESTLDVE